MEKKRAIERWLSFLFGKSSAAPAAGSFARGGKGTKTPFLVGLLRLVVSTGGQNLRGLRLSFRATGPWRSECLGLPLLSGPPSLCHVVWLGGKLRADETSAPTKKLPCRGGCPHPPANPHQPLRLVATGALSTSSLPDSPRITQPAAAAQKRSQSAVPAAPALRNYPQGSVPRNGGPGESRHGGPGGWPPVRLRRPPAILWLLSHRWESNIPAKRPSNFHTISPKVKKRAIRGLSPIGTQCDPMGLNTVYGRN